MVSQKGPSLQHFGPKSQLPLFQLLSYEPTKIWVEGTPFVKRPIQNRGLCYVPREPSCKIPSHGMKGLKTGDSPDLTDQWYIAQRKEVVLV